MNYIKKAGSFCVVFVYLIIFVFQYRNQFEPDNIEYYKYWYFRNRALGYERLKDEEQREKLDRVYLIE